MELQRSISCNRLLLFACKVKPLRRVYFLIHNGIASLNKNIRKAEIKKCDQTEGHSPLGLRQEAKQLKVPPVCWSSNAFLVCTRLRAGVERSPSTSSLPLSNCRCFFYSAFGGKPVLMNTLLIQSDVFSLLLLPCFCSVHLCCALQSESPSSHWCTLSCMQTSRVCTAWVTIPSFLLYLCAWSLKNTLEAVINQLRRCTKARLSPDAYQTFSLLSNVRLERNTQQPAHPPPPRAGKVKRVLAVCLCVCGSPSRLHYLCSSGSCLYLCCVLRRGPTLFVDARSPPSGPVRSSHVGASRVTAVHCLPPPSSTRVPSSTAR